MENFYTVNVLTPQKTVAKDALASSLLVPTQKGQINILENHTHIITPLAPGILSLFGGSDDPDRHFVMTSGICKLFGRKVSILARVCEEAHEINKSRAERALQNAEEALAERSLSDHEIKKYRNKVERARIRIQLADMVSSGSAA